MKYRFIINAANGGEDFGKIRNNIKTKDLNLQISKYLDKRLKELNVSSHLIREEDETINNEERLNFIKKLIKENEKLVVITNVVDFSLKKPQIIYSVNTHDDFALSIAYQFVVLENRLTPIIKKSLPINISEDYYYIQRNLTDVESIIIRYPNSLDLEDILEALIKGVITELDVEYIPLVKPGYHLVVKGDTLWSIAKKYNLSVNELKSLNDLKNNAIFLNRLIKVKYIEEVKRKEEDEEIKQEILHSVKPHETIYQIASNYGVDVEKIIKANNLISFELDVNQLLLIP